MHLWLCQSSLSAVAGLLQMKFRYILIIKNHHLTIYNRKIIINNKKSHQEMYLKRIFLINTPHYDVC